MALTWTEQHFDRGTTESSSGFGRVRGWKVTGDESVVDVVTDDPSAPRFGDVHPDYPLLVVNNVSFLPEGRHVVVRAQYVPIEFQDPTPPENEDDLEFFKIDTTFEDVDIEIPVFELVTKEFPIQGGGTETKDVWQPVRQKATFRYSRTVHRITLNATVAGGAGVITQLNISQAVNEQTNKIHQIGGVKYLFKSDSVRRTKIDNYQFTYRWIYDPGVPNTLEYDLSYSPNMGGIGSYGFPYASSEFVVEPYSRLDTAPNASDPTQVPVVVSSPAYMEDLTGYTTLPGVS